MDQATQAQQSDILLGYLESNTTAMATDVYQQPVAQYTDPDRLAAIPLRPSAVRSRASRAVPFPGRGRGEP